MRERWEIKEGDERGVDGQFTCFVCGCSVVSDFVTPWTVARQAPLSMGFSRQEYWSGLPFPSPGDLPDPGMEPMSLRSPALAVQFFTSSSTYMGSPYVLRNHI